MPTFYADEDFPGPAVTALQALGYVFGLGAPWSEYRPRPRRRGPPYRFRSKVFCRLTASSRHSNMRP